jgi:hypothetical protein
MKIQIKKHNITFEAFEILGNAEYRKRLELGSGITLKENIWKLFNDVWKYSKETTGMGNRCNNKHI